MAEAIKVHVIGHLRDCAPITQQIDAYDYSRNSHSSTGSPSASLVTNTINMIRKKRFTFVPVSFFGRFGSCIFQNTIDSGASEAGDDINGSC